MNWLDYLITALLLFSVAVSARRGFSREIVGLAASLAAYVLGMWFYGLAGSYVAPYVGSQQTANFIGFLLVVVGVLIGGGILGWIVSRFIRNIGLSFVDRLLGAAFGFVRGLLIVMALLTAFIAFGPSVTASTSPGAVVHSRFAPWVLEAAHRFTAAAPNELKTTFREQYRRITDELRRRRGNQDR